jgi:hypothetical protein
VIGSVGPVCTQVLRQLTLSPISKQSIQDGRVDRQVGAGAALLAKAQQLDGNSD